MKNKKIQILAAYVYHAVFILLGFLFILPHPVFLLKTFTAVSILYLIYWIVLNRKGHMAWAVYLNFVIGTIIEAFFYFLGIMPMETGIFANLGHAFYLIFLFIFTVVLGIANLILWLIDKHRHKKQTKKSDLSQTKRSETAK